MNRLTVTGRHGWNHSPYVRRILLLDGQQRLSSLFQALWLAAPMETSDSRGKPVERWYYVDIEKAIGPSADRDEAILSVPADKVLRTDFNLTVVRDLSTEEAECAAGLFPYTWSSTPRASTSGRRAASRRTRSGTGDRWGQFDDLVGG